MFWSRKQTNNATKTRIVSASCQAFLLECSHCFCINSYISLTLNWRQKRGRSFKGMSVNISYYCARTVTMFWPINDERPKENLLYFSYKPTFHVLPTYLHHTHTCTHRDATYVQVVLWTLFWWPVNVPCSHILSPCLWMHEKLDSTSPWSVGKAM